MTALSGGAFGFGTDSWPGAAKLMEEAGEVVQVISKLIVNGGDTNYWGDRDLHQLMIEELGDLAATLIFFGEQNFNEEDRNRIAERAQLKLERYAVWKGKREDG
jgi:NTP pyrophosphatase (non-canonical NTP hydrolase)